MQCSDVMLGMQGESLLVRQCRGSVYSALVSGFCTTANTSCSTLGLRHTCIVAGDMLGL